MSVAIHSQAKQNQLLRFNYGAEEITAERLPRPPGPSQVLIKVHPDCRVRVFAPLEATDEQVLSALQKRSRWIYQQIRNFRQQLIHIRPRRYVSGESHYYLGKQYLLKVSETSDEQVIKLYRGKLEAFVSWKDPEIVREMLLNWYKEKAREVFSRRLEVLLEQALWIKDKPSISIRSMKTQWGSCSPQGRLSLNPHLVKAPGECIDYVILHELCHIAEHNHSRRFYRLMKQVMPNWELVKLRLDRMAAVLLNDV